MFDISNNIYFLIQLGTILVFGLIVLALEVRVIVATASGWDVRSTRIVGLTLVVIAALCVLALTDTEARMSPIMAVLGSIAGYLFGRTDT